MSHGPSTVPASLAEELELEVLLRELDDVVAPPLPDVLDREPLDVLAALVIEPAPVVPELTAPVLVPPLFVDPPLPLPLPPPGVLDARALDVVPEPPWSPPVEFELSPQANATRARRESGSARRAGRRRVMVP
jgi:hypothetical protein